MGICQGYQSSNSSIKEGERLFGYFPPGDTLIINPIKITDQGFSDGKDHRKDLPAVYNNYIRVNGDNNYDPSKDNLRSLLFPLHITSFCICDALEDEAYLDADQIIIVSASSKTAIGLAQGLQETLNKPQL